MPQTSTQIRFFSVLSDDPRTDQAASDVTRAVGDALNGRIDLLMAFYTAHHLEHIDSLHQCLREVAKSGVLLGASAEGIIGRQREIEGQPGLAVLAASLPGADLSPFYCARDDWNVLLGNEDALAEKLLGQHLAPADTRCLLLLPDPFSSPLLRILPEIDQALPGVPVVGGVASAARRPGVNRLMMDDQLVSGGTVGLTVGGEIHVATTVSQGCRPIGRPFVITKAKRHILQELGGRKALEAIEQTISVLSEEDRELCQTNGLLIGRVIDEYKNRFGRGDFVIRSIVGADRNLGYIAVGDPQIRIGQTVQLHVRDQATAHEDFQLLLEAQKIHGPASGALLFSCNGRGSRLFDDPNADAEMVHEALGEVPLAGFFASGEIGPVGNQCFLHGHTASLVTFRPGAE